MMNHDKPEITNVTIAKKSDLKANKHKDLVTLEDDNDLTITIEDNIEVNLSYLYHRMRVQEIKLILHYTFEECESNGKSVLKTRKTIRLNNCNLENYCKRVISLTVRVTTYKKKDNEIYNKEDIFDADGTSPIQIGIFKVLPNSELEPMEEELFDICASRVEEYENDIWKRDSAKLSEYLKYDSVNNESIIDDYIQNGMLKLYYDSIFETIKNNDGKRIAGKSSAMCSYIAIRDYLNKFFVINNLDYEVSNPNVFVKNKNTEFDALIIKKNKCGECNKSKYFFDEGDIEAVIEIKTAGYFSSFKNDIKEDFLKYIDSGKLDGKKYIYFSIAESYGVRNKSKHFYEYLFATIQDIGNDEKYKDAVFGIFCGLHAGNQKMVIPFKYDLDKYLKEIFL